MTGDGIDVIVVEDHPLYARALTGCIEAIPGMRIHGVYDRLMHVPDALPAGTVAVVDLGLPDVHGVNAIPWIRSRGAHVLVVSATEEPQVVLAALQAGARGYLTKHAHPDQIRHAISAIASGGSYISPTLAPQLLPAGNSATTPAQPELTHRERQVLVQLASGATDQEIADALRIRIRTVRSYLERVREKTGYRRRPELTRYAIACGLVDADGDAD